MAKQSKSTSNLPKMGTSVASGVTAQKPIKGRSVPKTNQAKGGALEAATAFHRPNIQERLGAKLHPTATLYAPNAAAANDVQRNVVTVPSAMGNRDFWLKRRYGQGI